MRFTLRPVERARPTGVGRFTRLVLAIDLVAVTFAGLQLFVFSTRTADYFAWTIKAPITAALLGVGYWCSIPSLVLALREREWQRVRTLIVMGSALTWVMALATFRHLGRFHLDAGPDLARAAAWTWLVVYVTVPLMLAAAFVRQERAGGLLEYGVVVPLRPWARTILVVHAVPLTALGLGLALWPGTFAGLWPWPLTPLAAGAVAAGLLAVAAGCWWSLREGDWRRVRIGFPALILFDALALVVAARFSEALDGGDAATWIYLGALLASLVAFAAVAGGHERRAR